jgi:hypothetical protein
MAHVQTLYSYPLGLALRIYNYLPLTWYQPSLGFPPAAWQPLLGFLQPPPPGSALRARRPPPEVPARQAARPQRRRRDLPLRAWSPPPGALRARPRRQPTKRRPGLRAAVQPLRARPRPEPADRAPPRDLRRRQRPAVRLCFRARRPPPGVPARQAAPPACRPRAAPARQRPSHGWRAASSVPLHFPSPLLLGAGCLPWQARRRRLSCRCCSHRAWACPPGPSPPPPSRRRCLPCRCAGAGGRGVGVRARLPCARADVGGRAHRRRWGPHRCAHRLGPCGCGGCSSREGCRSGGPSPANSPVVGR